jgi:hypothetical protein
LRKIIYYTLLSISILGIPFFLFGNVNTMVSLKYETENPGDCISLVSGQDLYLTITILQGLILLCMVCIVLLLVFKKRILKQSL